MKKKKEVKVKQEIFQPTILLKDLGSDKDPCFGKLYDLTTNECKQCGDSELCCIKFAEKMGTTRKELEKVSKYKDLEVLLDKKAVFKSIRNHKRKGLKRPEILDRIQAKYNLSREEAKMLYEDYKTNKEKKDE